MIKAIILDRDGVITNNSEHYYVWNTSQLQFVDGIFSNLKLLIRNGFQLFIVSNQGGISKKLYSSQDILKLHQEISIAFAEQQIEIKEMLFCPHHPEVENCLCRKPEPLMIEKLVAKYELDKNESWFIGDSDSDMQAAEKAGIKGIKISPNQNLFPYISFLIR